MRFLKIYIRQQDPWSNLFAFYLRDETMETPAFGEPVTMSQIEEGTIPYPTFELDTNTCQNLIDSLWDVGFRPSEGSGSAGAMKATQDHLEDMRKLVFDETQRE